MRLKHAKRRPYRRSRLWAITVAVFVTGTDAQAALGAPGTLLITTKGTTCSTQDDIIKTLKLPPAAVRVSIAIGMTDQDKIDDVDPALCPLVALSEGITRDADHSAKFFRLAREGGAL